MGLTSRTSALAIVDLPDPDSPTTASEPPRGDGERHVVDGAVTSRRRAVLDDEVAHLEQRAGGHAAPPLVGAGDGRRGLGRRHRLVGVLPRPQRGDRGEQRAGVLVRGCVDDLLDGPALDEPAGLHHVDAVAHEAGDAEVVGDEEDGDAGALLDLQEQVEDAGLHGDVEGGGRLVGDDEAGLGRQRHRDEHALEHAAGELVRVLLQPALGHAEVHLLEQVQGAGRRRPSLDSSEWASRIASTICLPTSRSG